MGGIARDDGSLLPPARGGAGKEIKSQRGRGGLSDVGAIHFGKREGARLQDRADAVLRGTPEHGSGAANPVAAGLPNAPIEGDLELGVVRLRSHEYPRRMPRNGELVARGEDAAREKVRPPLPAVGAPGGVPNGGGLGGRNFPRRRPTSSKSSTFSPTTCVATNRITRDISSSACL